MAVEGSVAFRRVQVCPPASPMCPPVPHPSQPRRRAPANSLLIVDFRQMGFSILPGARVIRHHEVGHDIKAHAPMHKGSCIGRLVGDGTCGTWGEWVSAQVVGST